MVCCVTDRAAHVSAAPRLPRGPTRRARGVAAEQCRCDSRGRLAAAEQSAARRGAQAQATQDANRAATSRMPPAWAVLAMVVLGFNEFLALLYNPLYILLGLVLFLFGRTVYQARPRPRARRPCAQAEHIGASNSIDTRAAARAQVGAGRLLCQYKTAATAF